MRKSRKTRDQLLVELRSAYEGGASIRTLVASTGRSYGSVHSMLRESGTAMRSRGGPNHHPVSSPLARHFRRDGLSLAYRTLDQIEDGAKALRVFAGGHPGDQAVEHQVQVAHQYVAGDVVAHPSGLLLST